IPAVHLLQQYGVPKFHELLRQAGLTTLHRPPSHYGLSLILGGAEATLWDVTSLYAKMGRSLLGLPQTMPRLLASETAEGDGNFFHPGGVWQVFNALTEVNRPEEIDWKSIPSMRPVAWKTGTSYGFRDAWAVGVTPRYAVGVWVGNASGEGKPGLVGARTAGPVLFDVLSLLPAAPTWFERPDGVFVDAEVCRLSGHLKGRFCLDADTVLILPAGRRTAPCPYHRPVILTADGAYRLHQECADSEPTLSASWFALPPVWEWYYKQHHPEYRPLPPFKPGCGGDASQAMQFIYPTPGARITLPRQMDGTPGHLVARVACGQAGATLFWHLDDDYLGETRDFHEMALQPAPGRHALTVVDGEGNTVSVTFHISK
ncbi:MAG TPA: penicillin-binding protein 1C, partial [Candidatus Bacteroides pullicola]|nr:penicillin-binding protein 1C [Candidatus Bacteroides pullicola]